MAPIQLGLATAVLGLPQLALSAEPGRSHAGALDKSEKVAVSVNAHGDFAMEKEEKVGDKKASMTGRGQGEGSAKTSLFEALDANGDGVVSLAEFQVERADMVGKFESAVAEMKEQAKTATSAMCARCFDLKNGQYQCYESQKSALLQQSDQDGSAEEDGSYYYGGDADDGSDEEDGVDEEVYYYYDYFEHDIPDDAEQVFCENAPLGSCNACCTSSRYVNPRLWKGRFRCNDGEQYVDSGFTNARHTYRNH
mmetsp:Transcript_98462/g.246715  ORF Transcript_98462/g.246715 Transcript_98462/m.246715 type:complete len:252 (-) Transcript_98462:102-857(-)